MTEYSEFIIIAPGESRDALTARLADMGAIGFLDEGETVTAYFRGSDDLTVVAEGIEAFRTTLEACGLSPDFSYRYATLPDKDWNESWKKGFSPIDVGAGFTVIPSWLQNETSRIPLIIDPGMVFGTGHHESTRACLALIEKFGEKTPKRSFLDIGTGTGILAIAASRLGFQKVTGIDIDPLCVEAASRNRDLNGLDNIELREGGLSSEHGTFDMIAANLLSEILIGLAQDISLHLEKDGIAVVSGIMTGQEAGVKEAMASAGLLFEFEMTDGQWVSLVYSRKTTKK